MLARTRLKLKNAESSIAFLQEQHAKTLEDLHKEIERLQKKSASEYLLFVHQYCTDITIMQDSHSSSP